MMAYNIIKTFVYLLFVHLMKCEPTNSTGPTNTTTPESTLTNTTNRPIIDDGSDIIKLIKNSRGRCGYEYEVIDVLAEKSESQRQELIKQYNLRYKKDLIELVGHRFIGSTYEAIVALLTTHKEYYARELHKSTNGLGTDEQTISEILGSMNRSEINDIFAVYENDYNSTVKDDLMDDTSGAYKDLVIAWCDALRNETKTIDFKAAKYDARALKAASKGNDDKANKKTFITILTTRSFPQLKVIFNKFAKCTNMTILDAIAGRFEDDLQYGLSIIVKNVLLSKSEFYAGQLEEAMSNVIYNEHQLTRIIVGRSEIDLNDIKETYKKIYGTDLIDKISANTGGGYNRLLLNLLKK